MPTQLPPTAIPTREPPTAVPTSAPASGDAAIAAASVAPKEAGQYAAVWNLRNAQNVPFGESLWVAVTRTLTHASSRTSRKMRLSRKKITEDLIDRMMGWRHSAFNE